MKSYAWDLTQAARPNRVCPEMRDFFDVLPSLAFGVRTAGKEGDSSCETAIVLYNDEFRNFQFLAAT